MIQDKMQILEKDIVIPDVVLKKAENAFDIIHADEKCRENQDLEKEIRESRKAKKEGEEKRKMIKVRESAIKSNRRLKTRLKAACVLAAVLVLAFGTACFAYHMNWSRGIENSLHATEEIKTQAEEIKLADFPEQSVTCNGITVTAKQSIVDNYYALLSFEVSGFELADNEEPAFEYMDALVDGEFVSWDASFYDGVIAGDMGKAVYEDGTPLQTDADGRTISRYKAEDRGKAVYEDGTPLQTDSDGRTISRYKTEDGTLEYHMYLNAQNREGFFLNKPVSVKLKNLGTYTNRGEYENRMAGEWSFNWTLQGSDEIYKAECNAPLGDTGVTVTGVEISPISIKAVYDAPRQTIQEEAAHAETGETFLHETYVEPPALVGVRMKDGTAYPYLYMGPGQMGYMSKDSSQYVYMFAVDRILDVNQVDAFLFQKSESGERTGTEDDCYVVEIGREEY
ncbi:MAG: DUF4179 domain-containing protein [Butyrivibrio sp.]|nr:DUF4179 domain-containing protein [Butyrivibrio sp.]